MHFVIETISRLTESAIFAYLGLFMFTTQYRWNYALVGFSVLGMLSSRAIMISFCSLLINKLPICKCARTSPGNGRASMRSDRGPLRGMSGVEIIRNVLFLLRRHPGGIRLARHAPRTEQGSLHIVFAQARLAVVKLSAATVTLCHDRPPVMIACARAEESARSAGTSRRSAILPQRCSCRFSSAG